MVRSLFLVIAVIVIACTPLATPSPTSSQGAKILKLRDSTYEPNIQTVRLFAAGQPLSPAVSPLNAMNLRLEFDDLTSERQNYMVKLIHCNQDWTQSPLQDLNFLEAFNEFPINNAEFSIDTHIPYVHYWFSIPQVKLPGNYVAVVYREGNKDDIILSKRFMVYANQVVISRDERLIGAGAIANQNQQLNFTVNYKNVQILNPAVDVNVSLRQNQRWDNMYVGLKPTFIRNFSSDLEYKVYEEKQMFKGGNEFRFFDIRSLRYPGRNVHQVNDKVAPYEIYLGNDKARVSEAYAQYDEMNGNYIIDNYDFRDLSYCNYAYVNFSLPSSPIPGEVYVQGGFNNWNLNETNLMQYDSAQRRYKARILLKQGHYDYQYYVKSNSLPPHYLEGSHYQTENMYEIFVYYRPFQPRADLLIGYVTFVENPR